MYQKSQSFFHWPYNNFLQIQDIKNPPILNKPKQTQTLFKYFIAWRLAVL